MEWNEGLIEAHSIFLLGKYSFCMSDTRPRITSNSALFMLTLIQTVISVGLLLAKVYLIW